MIQRPEHSTPYRGRRAAALLAAIGCFWLTTGALASELRETPIVKAVQRVRGAVVNIRGEKTITTPAAGKTSQPEAARRVNGMGTGVVIDPRGYIITNHHVVDGVHEIMVTSADGCRRVAKLLARDLETDLALIKIDPPGPMPVMPLGDSSDLMAGETVIALGNAFGYEHTVTRGILSALHRKVQVSDAQFYNDLIQTDASINPGNSGGPLLNIDGDMIGVNVAVRAGAQGIGFAIPVNKVTAVATQLLADCNADKKWIGITSSSESLPQQHGLVVGTVDVKSPAADAGLTAGDRIVAVDDMPIERPMDFHRAMLDRAAGQSLHVTVQRSGKPLTMDLTLGCSPASRQPSDQPAWNVLGLELKPIPAEEFRRNRSTRYRGGLLIASVRPNSPASSQGITAGDVLVGMHIWETTTMENVAYILKRPDFAQLSPMKFFILRGDETLYGYLPAATPKTAQR